MRLKDLSKARIGITGSPATGKKTVAKELAAILKLDVVFLSDLALRNKIADRNGKEFEVDSDRLSQIVGDVVGKIVVGHMLPEVMKSSRLDFVAILRSSPNVLRKRYLSRGYEPTKIQENLLTEVLDVVSFNALKRYGRRKVSEFDTSKVHPRTTAQRIVETLRGRRKRNYGKILWLRNARSSKILGRAIYFSSRKAKKTARF